MITSSRQSGNVLFLILIAVALFAALSYAVTNSNRVGAGSTTKEKAQLSQGVIDSYTAAINGGTTRLQMRGCTSIDYTPPAGWGAEDHKCHLFHPEGGGVIYQNIALDGVCSGNMSSWTSLAAGAGCDGIVYVGINGGSRIYTTISDQGSFAWASALTSTGANSSTNGLSNTNNLLARSDATYAGAGACRALGPKWYWPAESQLVFLWNNRNTGSLAGTFNNSAAYWSSTEESTTDGRLIFWSSGTAPNGYHKAGNLGQVRCIRTD